MSYTTDHATSYSAFAIIAASSRYSEMTIRSVYIGRVKEGGQTGPRGWKGHRTWSKLRGRVDMKYDKQEPKPALLKIKSVAGK
jgi:hypothetical protein